MSRSLSASIALVLAIVMAGCATKSQAPLERMEVARPAYSLKATNDNMIVAVSPARQTLQIAGSAGLLIGSSISAISNARHRKVIYDALGDYDAGAVFDTRLSERLEAAYGGEVERVEPLGSTAGQKNVREAELARRQGLRRAGYDEVLDVKMTYGLFGFEGTLIAKLEGELMSVEGGKTIWRDGIVVSSAPILASDKLTDPTKRLGPNFSSPRLSVDENAIDQWTDDGGQELRARFETAVDGAASALLVQLGLAEEATGYFYLGKLAMNRKKFEMADTLYMRALALNPNHMGARNGVGVNRYHRGKVKDAVAWLQELVTFEPNFGPAHYNLAWILAEEGEDIDGAKMHYNRALELGMPEEKKIEKVIGAA